MKEQIIKSLEACWLKGLSEEVLVTVTDGTIITEFNSNSGILAGVVQQKVSEKDFHDMTFMILDSTSFIKSLNAYKNPTISFKSRTGEENVANPYSVEIKEGRSRLNFVLGLQSVFRKPRIVKNYETLFKMTITPDLSKTIRNESRLLNIDTFFIQESKKHTANFVVSTTAKKLSDYLVIETNEKVENNIPDDMRFDIKSFIAILNQYSECDIVMSFNEKYMALEVKSKDITATYYLAKIKQI